MIGSGKQFFFTAIAIVLLAAPKIQAQNSRSQEMQDVEIGIERVARFFTPIYQSLLTSGSFDNPKKNTEQIWVQVDLGSEKKIDEIKLLPAVLPLVFLNSYGFPARFILEVSNDPEFKSAIPIANNIANDYPDPIDKVCAFTANGAKGRYVRLTATLLRQKQLALTKMMVVSNGKDIAEGCTVTSSTKLTLWPDMLTRPPRPQGEFVVTNNPGNVTQEDTWSPVANQTKIPANGSVQLGEGIFKKTMENNIGYLLSSFTVDQMVRSFRVRADKPVQPFDEKLHKLWMVYLPGSESARYLMGAGNTLRWTENKELRKRMNEIVDVIDVCKEPDGYIMAYPKKEIFVHENGAYVRAWVVHGLADAGFAGNKKAFSLLRQYGDWFNGSCYLPELLRRAGQGTQGIIPMTRTYFTPVGKSKDIQVAQQYFQENYWLDQLINRDEKAIWQYPYDRPHCYLITALEPYLDMYRATGDKKYMDATMGGWDLFHDCWEHVGGAISICEGREGTDLYPPKSYYLNRNTGELCGNIFWIYLNHRLNLLYPKEEKYVTEIEKSIYNIAIANQEGQDGIRYSSRLVGRKDPARHINTCCEAQGSRLYGALPEFIYSTANDGVFVNLYAASSISIPLKKGTLSLKMSTQFPYDPKVKIDINASKDIQATIHLRIPSWASQVVLVMVDGKKIATGNPGTFLTLDRKWKNGDVISFSLPMEFKLSKYMGAERIASMDRYALEYGPLLMALVGKEGQKEILSMKSNPEKLIKELKPIDGKPVHFAIEGNPDLEYLPYLEVKDEAFTCYPEIKK